MKIIIIGGVAGGATTAARIRRVDETAEIILLEKGKHISYANCGLPYYIGGVIEEREKLFVQTPEAFSTRFRVDVRTENEVIFIDRKKKTVTVRQSSEDTYEESYDKLLISTGASPVRPPLPGIDLPGIFTLRNVTDTDRIKEYINSHSPRKAVVVGAGFIGLEMAENLHAQGAKVSIVEMGNQVMAPIDFSMASLVHQHLMDKGVNLYLEHAVFCHQRGGVSNQRIGIPGAVGVYVLPHQLPGFLVQAGQPGDVFIPRFRRYLHCLPQQATAARAPAVPAPGCAGYRPGQSRSSPKTCRWRQTPAGRKQS